MVIYKSGSQQKLFPLFFSSSLPPELSLFTFKLLFKSIRWYLQVYLQRLSKYRGEKFFSSFPHHSNKSESKLDEIQRQLGGGRRAKLKMTSHRRNRGKVIVGTTFIDLFSSLPFAASRLNFKWFQITSRKDNISNLVCDMSEGRVNNWLFSDSLRSHKLFTRSFRGPSRSSAAFWWHWY